MSWRVVCALVTSMLAFDRAITLIGLNLLAHETWNRAQKRELRRISRVRVERRCQQKITREKQREEELAEQIRKAMKKK